MSFPQDYHFTPDSRLAVVIPEKLDWRSADDYGGYEGSRGGIYRRTGFESLLVRESGARLHYPSNGGQGLGLWQRTE